MEDITENRHKGNPESVAAFELIHHKLPRQRRMVLDAVQRCPKRGLTCRELKLRWGVDMNAISGRFTELKKRKLIFTQGTRDGCAIYFPTQ